MTSLASAQESANSALTRISDVLLSIAEDTNIAASDRIAAAQTLLFQHV